MAEKMMGHSPSGLFGYSHMLGGFPGGQAQYARVPSGRRFFAAEKVERFLSPITGIDIVVALRIESDLNHARKVTQVARNRVRRTSAIPNASNGMRHSGGTPAVDVPRDIEVSIVEIVGS